MKAPDFDYACPTSLLEALSLLARSDRDVVPLAGGQSLMPMMNFRLSAPEMLVDLNAIDELRGIVDAGDTIKIGAMTTYADLERSDLVTAHLPLMSEAIRYVAHPAIRNRGTIGGSVALADPAAEMPALLLALAADVIIESLHGERTIDADDFFTGLYETALRPGEIVKVISISKDAGARRFVFEELARRHGDYAIAGLALTVDDVAPLTGLRLAFFGVGDRAFRAIEVERALVGHARDDDQALQRATQAVGATIFDGDLNASALMKRHLAGVLLQRAVGKI
ncbi:MAG: FAD binding domain-containing protein [Geminicoccaceae bacterium]